MKVHALPSHARFALARRARWPGALAALTLGAVVACSSSDDGEAADPPSTTTTTTTRPATEAAAPVISDGEEWIAYQGVEQGIKLTRPDGTESHVILGPPGDQVHFDWSPDGSEIAYVQSTDTTPP